LDYRDFVVFPLVVSVIYAIAYAIRPSVTDEVTRRYFFPALTVKIAGALIVGLVYQFYYAAAIRLTITPMEAVISGRLFGIRRLPGSSLFLTMATITTGCIGMRPKLRSFAIRLPITL